MPPWIGPVTIGLGTVGLSRSRCEPAAGPLPFGLELGLESASALPAVMSPTASAAPTMARVTPPDARPVIASPSSERRFRAPGGDYVNDLRFPARDFERFVGSSRRG